MRWRVRPAVCGEGSLGTRWSQGRVRQEAEGPAGLACGANRVSGRPVPPGGAEGGGLGPECKRHGEAPLGEGNKPASVPWGEVGVGGFKGSVQCAQGSSRIRRRGWQEKIELRCLVHIGKDLHGGSGLGGRSYPTEG